MKLEVRTPFATRTLIALVAMGAFAVMADARDVPKPASPDVGAIDAVLFLERKADAELVEKQIADMLARAASRAQGLAEGASKPVVTVRRSPPAEPRAKGDVVSFHVTLPEGVSREAFLQALAQDEECRASRESCAAHCKLMEAIATGGHWHLKVPVNGRQCLAVFAASGDEAEEARRLVAGQPGDFGLRRKPRISKVRITFDRPDFRNLPK